MPAVVSVLGNAYISVFGLCLDILGFALLWFELRRGHFEAEAASAALRDAFSRLRTEAEKIDVDFHNTMDGVGSTASALRDFGIAASKIDAEKLAVNPLRTKLAYAGIVLVLVGFVLQMIGSWPLQGALH